MGAIGPTGAIGATGDGLMSGALLLLPAGSPAPAGYTFLGTFDLSQQGGNAVRGRPASIAVDVYRKN